MNKFEFNRLCPFKWFVLENFPFIEADFDAITNYQLYCKVVEYLNKVIENNNAIGIQTENLTNAFIELQDYVNNYFENLDVQDEINNKLDDMVESGTLQEIIADYLNSKAIFGFDTVNDMKNSTNLIDGSYAQTLGYYSKNDGGKALYKIRTITNDDIIDNSLIIPLSNNSLIAELIYNNIINPLSLGAKANGLDDDSQIISKCIDIGAIIDGQNKTYKADIIINKSNIELTNFKILGMITISNNLSFVNINNSEIDATGKNYGITATDNVTKLYIDNCYIHNAELVGLNLINAWDNVLTRISLSSNKKGLYVTAFNHGVFQGTAYGNEIGLDFHDGSAMQVNATAQENKKTGVNVTTVHGSTFELYLEQNGYEGTTFKEQSQLLVGDNGARCLGTTFNIYAMGGSNSEMESHFGATFLSAISCIITGRFERHIDSGIRIGSSVINCQCNVIDVNHTNYGYDDNLQQFIYKIGDKLVNTSHNIPETIKLLYTIRSSTPLLTSIEHPSSSTTIIRAKDIEGNTPTNINAEVYGIVPSIITTL